MLQNQWSKSSLKNRKASATTDGYPSYDANDIQYVQLSIRDDGVPHYYLHSEIGECDRYTSLIDDLIRGCDEIHIHLSSPGGYLDTTQTIINAINIAKNRGCVVVGHADGPLISAATMIWAACEKVTVQPYSHMLFHDASASGMNMKFHELRILSDFNSKTLGSMYHDLYSCVFSTEEIDDLLNSGDKYYYTAHDVQERISKYSPEKHYLG